METTPVETAAPAPVKTKKPRSDKGKPKTGTLASNIKNIASTWQSHNVDTRRMVMGSMSPEELYSVSCFAKWLTDDIQREAHERFKVLENLMGK